MKDDKFDANKEANYPNRAHEFCYRVLSVASKSDKQSDNRNDE